MSVAVKEAWPGYFTVIIWHREPKERDSREAAKSAKHQVELRELRAFA
jgi:hypothetical protein